MYCCHGGWEKTMQSMFARSNGQEGQSGGKVAVKKTHTAQTINLIDQFKCNHELPVSD